MTTIYFAGTEDISFGFTVGAGAIGNGFRTGYSRVGMGINTGNGAFPPSSYAQTPTLGNISTLYMHGLYVETNGASNSTANGCSAFGLFDSGGVVRLAVQGTGSNGQLKIVKHNAAGTVTTLATTAVNSYPTGGGFIPFDLFVNYSTTGQATLYANGVLAADTGAGVDVTTDGNTTLASAFWGSQASTRCAWSEMLIQDTSTLGLSLCTIAPVAAGSTQSWLPNTVGDINPTTINDANFIATTANNALSEWTVSTALPAGTWSIAAVVQLARVSVGVSGPQHFEWVVRTSDGTDHTAGSVAAPVGSFGNSSHVWYTNPNTGVAWNPGELINAGIGSLA